MSVQFFKDKIERLKPFLIKHKKGILIGTPIFLLSTIILSLVLFLGPTVGVILTVVLKPAFSIKKINIPEKLLKSGEIEANGVILSYKGQKIVDAPKVVLRYDLNGEMRDWIKAIDVYNADILIERKGSDVNIVKAFSTNSTGKAGLGVPIGVIRAIDGDAIYRDISYNFPIEKHIPIVNGYVSFDKKKGIDLIFGGVYKDGHISYSFSNYVEDYSMTIKGENIDLDTNLLQYAYYYKDIEYLEGKGDLDLTVAKSGLYGSADIRGLTVNYKPFKESAKNIGGHVDFLKDKIKIDADFFVFGKKKKFVLDYDGTAEMNIDIILGEMEYSEVSKYEDLIGLNLPFKVENFQNTNINLKLDKKKDFYVTIDFDLPNLDIKYLNLKNLKNKLMFSNGLLTYSLLNSDIKIFGIKDQFKVDFSLKNKLGKINYSLENLNGEIGLKFLKDEIKIDSKSGFLVGKGSYNYDKKSLNIYGGKKLIKKYDFSYDFVENKIEKYEGILDFNFSNTLSGEMNAEVASDIGNIESLVLYDINNEEVFSSKGFFNLNNKKYDFEFETNLLNIDQDIAGRELSLISNVVGLIKGEGKDYTLEIDGVIDKLKFETIVLNGIKTNFRLKNDIVEIKKVGNGVFSLDGKVNLKDQMIDLQYKIKNLSNENVGVEIVKFVVEDAFGKLQGSLNNPKGTLEIEKAKVIGPKDEALDIKGKFKYFDGVLNTDEMLANNKSKIKGFYNLKDGNYKFKGDIIADSIWKYTDNRAFKYRMIGIFNLFGKDKKINVNSKYTVDNIYYKGKRLPDLEGDMEYKADNLNDGVLVLKFLKILKNGYEIGRFKGEANLLNKELNFYLDKKDIDLSKIYANEELKGKIDLNVDINGTLSFPKYTINTSSEKIIFEKWEFEDVIFDLSGDEKEVRLEKFDFLYEKNLLEALGRYDLLEKKYNFNLYSKNIKVDFLNSILSEANIEGIDGTAQIAMNFSEKESNGVFNGQNISFKMPKYEIDAKELNFNITLKENRVKLEYFKGVINTGKVDINGYFVIPSISEIKNNDYFYEKIDYDFSLKMDGVKYIYPEHLSLTLDSDINIASNKLIGKFNIREGELTKIPGVEENFSIFKMIREYIRNTILSPNVKNGTLNNLNGKESGNFGKILNLDLDFKIVNGIKIDLQSIFGVIEDIKGELTGGGKISGVGDRLKFIGSFDLKQGQYILNNNDFIISQGSVIFSKENEYYPNFNPIIIFESYSKNVQDNYEISLNGELKKLNFKIRSNRETSSGSLASLFSGDKKGDQNDSSGSQSFLVENVLNSQISNTFLRPFSNSLKTIFGLSKLRITSDISSFTAATDENNMDQNRDNTEYNLGAKIQAEKHLYDKLFLVGDVSINGSNQSSSYSNRTESGSGGSFNKYDGWIEYRIDNSKAWGIGANKVLNNSSQSETINDNQDNQDNMNYYIKFMFYKKYDRFSDIF
ncbi:MAG: translocation/assembly module TamB domain-containing protein [Fusobacteriaceae bacterium]|nr:translocation/assembly module TamB domain-containing protein [Fusobacteriaceae bacterium]